MRLSAENSIKHKPDPVVPISKKNIVLDVAGQIPEEARDVYGYKFDLQKVRKSKVERIKKLGILFGGGYIVTLVTTSC